MFKKRSLMFLFGLVSVFFIFSEGFSKDLKPPQSSGQLIVIKNNAQKDDLTRFAALHGAELTGKGTLSFGELFLLVSNEPYTPIDLFYANEESRTISGENSLIDIGPSLILQTAIQTLLPMSQPEFVIDPRKDLSAWQWGLHNTGINTPPQEGRPPPVYAIAGFDSKAFEGWKLLHPARKEVVVAVIDSGLDINHQDLKNAVWTNTKELKGVAGVDDDGNGYIDDIHGFSVVDNNGNMSDEHGHGTHCSGIIAADPNNEIGTKGLAPGVKILPIKVFNKEGSSSSEYLIKAIDYAVAMNVDVISASWGGGPKNDVMLKAIELALKKNIMFIAAAGNGSTNTDFNEFFPANYDLDNVISVASHRYDSKISSFSNFGRKSVDIAAPGQNILSTLPNNQYAVWSGTSMATPHVSAAVALLIQQEGPLSVLQIRERLTGSSLPTIKWRKQVSSIGRLNLEGLLLNAQIDRGLPKESDWKVYAPQSPLFETPHPISQLSSNKKDLNLVKDFYIPGAQFLRFVFSKVSIDSMATSTFNIRESQSRAEVDVIPMQFAGTQTFKTDFILGEYIGLRLNTSNLSSWGFRLEAIEYQ